MVSYFLWHVDAAIGVNEALDQYGNITHDAIQNTSRIRTYTKAVHPPVCLLHCEFTVNNVRYILANK